MNQKKIEITPYNELWKLEFFRIRDMLLKYLSHLNVGVEHIGSTAIEGALAKPIIDIDVIMNSYDEFEAVKMALIKAGFYHNGNEGVIGREVFKRKVADSFMKYHLYVCPVDGEELKRHLLFRNYMRKHEALVLEYNALKKELIKRYEYNSDRYTRGKTIFVEKVIALAVA